MFSKSEEQEVHFLGKNVAYWIELRDRFELENGASATELLEEVARLRGKLSFYESRIEQMYEVMKG